VSVGLLLSQRSNKGYPFVRNLELSVISMTAVFAQWEREVAILCGILIWRVENLEENIVWLI
jgi:hypothetical protein